MAGRWADCWNEQSEHMHELRLGQELRLDPCHLPQKIAFQGQNGILRATLAENVIIVQRNKIAATHNHKNDQAVVEIIPLSSYQGVSAHRLKDGKNDTLLALMLVHKNPSLSIPLLTSDNYDDVLLDWRLWADLYDLPMMVIDEFEELRPVRECAPLDYFLREYAPLQSLLNGKSLSVKKRFQLRLPNRRLKLRLKLSNRLIISF
ncbi:DUF6101 family protein [Bartonella sp. HY329]|uniref:DUF6101 family protein n=1 Tax=unclassified Bartonella TaxID=2645622 RepID=UPI0021CAD613|nr:MULTISPECIES: DUF6101 family protein [unclassified Bartonella]UXM95460.1 DUF6101 family protein [Bartonella sp. HY329]UXN09786.1 DUF6101 family protein [Bartonella sp. HY328]